MGGSQCADFGATPVTARPDPNQAPVVIPGLCRMGPGDDEGVVTYTDGRVATLTEPQAGQPAGLYIQPPPEDTDRTPMPLSGFSSELIARMRTLQGVEFGSCAATGFGSSVSSVAFLPTMSGGSPISWSPEDLRALYAALGQAEGQSANAFICSDHANSGRIAINNDGAHTASLAGAIETFNNSCGTLDSEHCEVMLASLRSATHQEEPTSTFWQALEYGGGLAGVAFAFGVVVPWLQKWLGPKDGDGGSGGTGGSGTGGSRGTPGARTRETTQATEPAATQTTQTFWGGVTALSAAGAAWLGRSALVQAGSSIAQGLSNLWSGGLTAAGSLPMPLIIIMPDCSAIDDPMLQSGFCSGSGPTA